ncbi:hypothetical protein ACOM2C_04240 [Pseudarthrobacter sp. So.54]
MTGTGPVRFFGDRTGWLNGHCFRPAGTSPPAFPQGPPELYSPGALFSWPELQALALDGVLVQLYQRGYLPPGTSPTPRLRARAAAILVSPAIRQRVVAGRMTAAWIYGCAAEPDRLALLIDANRRISSLRSTRGCTFHEVRLGPFDVVSLGGLLVTSPLRTCVDLALHVDSARAVPPCGRCWTHPNWGCVCGCSSAPLKRRPGCRTRRSPWRN